MLDRFTPEVIAQFSLDQLHRLNRFLKHALASLDESALCYAENGQRDAWQYQRDRTRELLITCEERSRALAAAF